MIFFGLTLNSNTINKISNSVKDLIKIKVDINHQSKLDELGMPKMGYSAGKIAEFFNKNK